MYGWIVEEMILCYKTITQALNIVTCMWLLWCEIRQVRDDGLSSFRKMAGLFRPSHPVSIQLLESAWSLVFLRPSCRKP